MIFDMYSWMDLYIGIGNMGYQNLLGSGLLLHLNKRMNFNLPKAISSMGSSQCWIMRRQ